MKTITTLVTLTLFASLTLTACGAKPTTTDKTTASATPTAQAVALSDAAVKEGTAKLLKTAKSLSKAATAGDEANIKVNGPKIEEVWATFEDGIKSKYPDFYEKIEKSLNPTVAGTKADKLDKDAILKLDNDLIQVLSDLSQKLVPVEFVKSAATQLIGVTNDMKKAVEAGDEAKIKEIGPKIEETWVTFEDGVKPRSSDLYDKIEKSLNPEVAGSQKSPIDKQALTQLNDGLSQALTELVQNIK